MFCNEFSTEVKIKYVVEPIRDQKVKTRKKGFLSKVVQSVAVLDVVTSWLVPRS